MSFRFLNNHKFTPFAHRGGSLENKENTLDAFEKCISIGYDYIETDVRETKDGKLVIFHDEDLSRICGLQIKINQLEYEEIKKIKIFDDHHVPLLDEALISWPHLNFNIEPKSTLAAHLLIIAIDLMIEIFTNILPILKNLLDLCVDAPHNLSLGTLTLPMLSNSFLNFID